MMGRPKGTQKVRHRSEEIHMTDKELHGTPLSTQPMYSSFQTKQGHWPGYGPKTGSRRDRENRAAPGPGEYGGTFSSFQKAAKSGVGKSTKEAGFGTSRRDEWMQDQGSPGVGAYSTTVADKKRKDFRNPSAPPLISSAKADTGPRAPTQAAPGPGEYGGVYSSFKKAASRNPTTYNKEGKVASTFGNSFKRDEWQKQSEAPGPCSYDVKDPTREGMASKRSYRCPNAPPFAAGSSGRTITSQGEVSALGSVAASPATDAGPGDYVAHSDFDVSRRTFNTFLRDQADQKARATAPRGRANSRGGPSRGTPSRLHRTSSQSSTSSRRSSSGRRTPRQQRYYDAADGNLM